jgi:hypothetical protein
MCSSCWLFICIALGRNIQDTTDGLHYTIVFDTPILNQWVQDRSYSIADRGYTFIWGGSEALLPMYRQSNPNMILSKYIPFSRFVAVLAYPQEWLFIASYRDPDSRDLAWWQANHPSWVLYACDQVTPAGLATDPEITLDISNPDVIGLSHLSTY